MKTIIFKLFNGQQHLNLFKLRNGEVVHIPTEDLPQIGKSIIPDIACYIQRKKANGEIEGITALVSREDVSEYTIEETVKYYDYYEVSETDFEIKEI